VAHGTTRYAGIISIHSKIAAIVIAAILLLQFTKYRGGGRAADAGGVPLLSKLLKVAVL
jgi:hypothetical protein